jgi:hypothetical protein
VETVAEYTVPEKILLAARQLEEQGQSPFSAETLIVASWQKFPRTFGLKGYADQYPDSNKVLSSIMGEKGLARRGWLSKMGQKLYALTPSGQQMAAKLMSAGDSGAVAAVTTSPRSNKLTTEQEKFLIGLFDAAATEKYSEGRKPELTFTDACQFWGVTENTHGDALTSQLERVRSQLAELERSLRRGDLEMSTGRSISADDMSQLIDAHNYLEERFSRHLNLLRTRADRS